MNPRADHIQRAWPGRSAVGHGILLIDSWHQRANLFSTRGPRALSRTPSQATRRPGVAVELERPPLIHTTEGGSPLNRIHIPRRLALGLGTAALLTGTLAGPAIAANIVTQEITGGGLTASVADVTLPRAAFQNAAHDVTGTMVLTAEDTRGDVIPGGWSTTIESSDFVWVGSATDGANIPAANFALTLAAAPSYVSGQAIDTTAATGPQVPPTIAYGTLASPIKTLRATAAYGLGKYTQDLSVTLTIPAQSRAGTYTGTLTTTISATP